jgi:hypothetical protein
MSATLNSATKPVLKHLRPLAERLRKGRSEQPAQSYGEWLKQVTQGQADSRPDMGAKKLH